MQGPPRPRREFSLNKICKFANGDSYKNDLFRHEAFANDKKVRVRWYLLRKEPVLESINKTYDEQFMLLTNEVAVPFAREMTYIVILYWLTHRERLLPEVWVRCQDKSSDNDRVYIGGLDSDGLGVSHYRCDRCSTPVGLASSRKV